MICAGAAVNTGSVIGDGVIINTNSSVDHHNRIGAFAHVAPGAQLGGEVSIGEGAVISIGSSVISGRSVGGWAVLGAGSVAIKDIPSNSVFAGVPARLLRRKK